MATPIKIKNKDGSVSYRIFVNYAGKRESKRLSTSQLAKDWAAKRKTELESEEIYGKKTILTIKEIIEDYIREPLIIAFFTTFTNVSY